jgi:hypothetical protein
MSVSAPSMWAGYELAVTRALVGRPLAPRL